MITNASPRECLNEELKRIEAKQALKLPLTERERALWTLYGHGETEVKE